MFGWFDRKHLGWLARFMQRARYFRYQAMAVLATTAVRGTFS